MNRYEYIKRTIMTQLKKKSLRHIPTAGFALTISRKRYLFAAFPIRSLSQYFDF